MTNLASYMLVDVKINWLKQNKSSGQTVWPIKFHNEKRKFQLFIGQFIQYIRSGHINYCTNCPALRMVHKTDGMKYLDKVVRNKTDGDDLPHRQMDQA